MVAPSNYTFFWFLKSKKSIFLEVPSSHNLVFFFFYRAYSWKNKSEVSTPFGSKNFMTLDIGTKE